jgi:hypothetical protein
VTSKSNADASTERNAVTAPAVPQEHTAVGKHERCCVGHVRPVPVGLAARRENGSRQPVPLDLALGDGMRPRKADATCAADIDNGAVWTRVTVWSVDAVWRQLCSHVEQQPRPRAFVVVHLVSVLLLLLAVVVAGAGAAGAVVVVVVCGVWCVVCGGLVVVVWRWCVVVVVCGGGVWWCWWWGLRDTNIDLTKESEATHQRVRASVEQAAHSPQARESHSNPTRLGRLTV